MILRKTPLFALHRLLNGGEAVHCFAVIFFACFCNGLGPLRMVDGIGIVLSLQADAAALAVIDATLAGFLQEIAGIELNTGAVSVDGHDPAGFRVGKLGAGIAENFPVMVIAALEVQRVVVFVDVPANGLGAAEIHGGAGDAAQLAGGDIFGIVGVEETSGEGQNLVHGGIYLVLACQVKVAVVGQIEDGILVADGIVDDVQAAFAVQLVGNLDNGIAGEALVTVGAAQFQGDGVFFVGQDLPHPVVVKVRAGVEVVSAFVGGHGEGLFADGEGGTLDPVGAAAYGGAQKAGAGAVAVAVVIA